MSAVLKKAEFGGIHQEIRSHQAWKGRLSGLVAEKMLRDQTTPYLYLLREGENSSLTEVDYYVSFVLPDLTVRHQPFVITVSSEGWSYEQGGAGGPYSERASIEDVLHLMMHCPQGANVPY